MVLFATDIAARGLDFAKLDWVLQMDCPEDVPAYIHRVGRTARYVSGRAAVLIFLKSRVKVGSDLKAFQEYLPHAPNVISKCHMNDNYCRAKDRGKRLGHLLFIRTRGLVM